MLEIKNLKAGYGKMQVLYDINLNVKPNEVAVLIGPNGAGKSTLLRSIFNLVDIYNGKIIFNGRDITRCKTHERIMLGISYVPQGRGVFNSLTIRENLEMGAFLAKDKGLVDKKVEEILKIHFPELRAVLDKYAYSLSGGQQQMLAMGRALMQEPKLLLLDEPSLGLAPKVMKDLFERIFQISRQKVTVMIVEQNARQATKIADRIHVLEDGKIALSGNKDLLKDKRIEKIYFGGR